MDDKRIAFAKVRFASPNEANKVKKALYNYWIGDKKLKIKSKEEIGYETYDNRTVIIRGIPTHIK